MTNQFRELTERLAMGINRDDCMAILITRVENEPNAQVNMHARPDDAALVTVGLALELLRDADREIGNMLVTGLKNVIAGYEQRRFEEKEIEE